MQIPDDPDDWTDEHAEAARRRLRDAARRRMYRGASGLLIAARCACRATREILSGAIRWLRHRAADQAPTPTDQG